ncbi:17658_t:CDS:2, partial [Racocetra persica]
NTNIWYPVPITEQEANTLKNENTIKKEELIAIINLKIRNLNNAEEIVDEENII